MNQEQQFVIQLIEQRNAASRRPLIRQGRGRSSSIAGGGSAAVAVQVVAGGVQVQAAGVDVQANS